MTDIKVGEFASSRPINKNEYRQGVILKIKRKSIILLGESGTKYLCHKDGVVKVTSLWGSTKKFVEDFNKSLENLK